MSVRIVHNKVLGGWYVVTGPHDSPLNGKFESRAEAQAWLNRKREQNSKESEGKEGGGGYGVRN